MNTPNTLPAPVAEPERIQAIDVLRGIALLGILPVNLISFAHVFAAYMNPSLAGMEGLDYVVWCVVHFVFEGKMITLFSLLFGAGLFLQVSRAEARRGRVGSARWLYLRRVFWLLVFGLIHAYLFWYGDILTFYALIGFLIYWLRRLRPRWLLSISFILLFLGACVFGLMILGLKYDPPTMQRMQREMNPPRAAIEKEVQQVRNASFLELAEQRAPKTVKFQMQMFLGFALCRITALMLLGIAFIKLDVLTAARSSRFYVRLAMVSLAIGLPLTAIGSAILTPPYDLVQAFIAFATVEYFGTFFMALGYLALVMLMVQKRVLPALQTRLAAVGRMAFTNYILHTLICTFVFNGWGLGQFGTWSRSQQFLLVLGIWALQLIVSPIWLCYFQFGPMEWLWRTLTYLKPQPFRRVAAGEPA